MDQAAATSRYRFILSSFARRHTAHSLLAYQLKDESSPTYKSYTQVRRRLERQGVMSYSASQRYVDWLIVNGYAATGLTSLTGAPYFQFKPSMKRLVQDSMTVWLKAALHIRHGESAILSKSSAQPKLTDQFVIALDDLHSSISDQAWREKLQIYRHFVSTDCTEMLLSYCWKKSNFTVAGEPFRLNKQRISVEFGLSRAACSTAIKRMVSVGFLAEHSRSYTINPLLVDTCKLLLGERLNGYYAAWQSVQ